MDRFECLARAFVELADTLVTEYDVVDLAHRLVEHSVALLPISASAIILSDADGKLGTLASSEQSRLLDLIQLQADAGPCVLAYRTGRAVFVDDLAVDQARWPAFAERGLEYNVRAVAALPMRLRDERIGAMNLFMATPGPLSATDIEVAQALADVATIGILHHRAWTHSESLNQQLQAALDSRVVIEQAKGVLAERGRIDVTAAFTLLRAHTRRTNQRLVDLARAVVDGADTAAILNPAD